MNYILTNANPYAPSYFVGAPNTFGNILTYDKRKAFRFKTLKGAAQFGAVNNLFIESVKDE